ncbi:DoxX family protein [Gordonia terrae]|uniref:DoxX family protein n=1 Tax=Gordonia terrae TaxID=2055 RepID=UPI00200B9C79|nr:DoxX family protein [Gordonia terrae]UPW07070.1 DoxX family protein [Gordonia terrae]
MLALTESAGPWLIGVYRMVIGFLFFCHGTTTLWAWPIEPYGGATAEFGAWPSWWAAAIQVVGGLLIMIGVGTRVAAFVSAGSMAVAYFWKHQGDGLLPVQNDGESSALFCWALLILVVIGPGKLAVQPVLDRLRGRATPANTTGSGTVPQAPEPSMAQN